MVQDFVFRRGGGAGGGGGGGGGGPSSADINIPIRFILVLNLFHGGRPIDYSIGN